MRSAPRALAWLAEHARRESRRGAGRHPRGLRASGGPGLRRWMHAHVEGRPRSSPTAARASTTPSTPWGPTSQAIDDGRRGARVRRPAHRRRPPGLRPRPRPAAYGQRAGPGLHDGARRPRPARVRVVEEPVGRPRRRGAAIATPTSTGCSPCAGCWRPSPTPTGRSSWRSRPSTRRGTAGWSSAGWWSCSPSSAGPGPDRPVRVMSFSYVALQRMQRLAPDLRLVMLIERPAHWPMLKPVLEDGWILGPGHRRADASTRSSADGCADRPRHPRLDGEHRRAARTCGAARRAGGDHRPTRGWRWTTSTGRPPAPRSLRPTPPEPRGLGRRCGDGCEVRDHGRGRKRLEEAPGPVPANAASGRGSPQRPPLRAPGSAPEPLSQLRIAAGRA